MIIDYSHLQQCPLSHLLMFANCLGKIMMCVVELRAIGGGAVPEDTLLKAAPDGMCATSCVVSGFNVAEYLAVPRNQAGFAQDQARVQEEAANVRAWLLGKAESMDQFQKDQYARRFRTLADGDYADDEDLKLYAKAIRHRIAVQTSVDADYPIRSSVTPNILWDCGCNFLSMLTTKDTSI